MLDTKPQAKYIWTLAPAACSLQAPSPPPPLPGLDQPLSPASDDSSYLAIPLARPQHRRRQRAAATPMALSPVQSSYGHGGQAHASAVRTGAAYGTHVTMMQAMGLLYSVVLLRFTRGNGDMTTCNLLDCNVAGRQQHHARPHPAWSSPELPPQKRPRQHPAHETSYHTQQRRWPFCCHAARPLAQPSSADIELENSGRGLTSGVRCGQDLAGGLSLQLYAGGMILMAAQTSSGCIWMRSLAETGRPPTLKMTRHVECGGSPAVVMQQTLCS